MSRDTVRALLIVVGLALIATVFSETSARIAAGMSGAIAVIFKCRMW